MTENIPVPTTKEGLIESLHKARGRLVAAISEIPYENYDIKIIAGWIIKDILAHIIEWDRRTIRDAEHLIEGKVLDLSHYEEMDAFNNEALRKYEGVSAKEVVDALIKSSGDVSRFLFDVSEADLLADRGQTFQGHNVTVWWLFQDLPSHDIEHSQQIVDSYGSL